MISGHFLFVFSFRGIYNFLVSLGSASNAGEFQEVEGETSERRRARLERHQRTAERAVSIHYLSSSRLQICLLMNSELLTHFPTLLASPLRLETQYWFSSLFVTMQVVHHYEKHPTTNAQISIIVHFFFFEKILCY